MKKLKLLFLLTMVMSLLGACSSSSNKNSVAINDQTKPFIKQYDKTFRSSINEMNDILSTFNTGLDDIYTGQATNEQFAELLTKSIDRSNNLVRKVESLDVDPQLFQQHQTLIVLVNRSHQLLLTAVDQAKNNQIEKTSLRTEYVSIKKDQSNVANQWKLLMQNLQSSENKK